MELEMPRGVPVRIQVHILQYCDFMCRLNACDAQRFYVILTVHHQAIFTIAFASRTVELHDFVLCELRVFFHPACKQFLTPLPHFRWIQGDRRPDLSFLFCQDLDMFFIPIPDQFRETVSIEEDQREWGNSHKISFLRPTSFPVSLEKVGNYSPAAGGIAVIRLEWYKSTIEQAGSAAPVTDGKPRSPFQRIPGEMNGFTPCRYFFPPGFGPPVRRLIPV